MIETDQFDEKLAAGGSGPTLGRIHRSPHQIVADTLF